MTAFFWHQKIPETWGLPPVLASWLTEKGSLTARCRRNAKQFSLRLLDERRGRSLSESPLGSNKKTAQVREVLLYCDENAVIFGHTTHRVLSRSPLLCWMKGLGNRSLGSILFYHPGILHGRLAFCRIDSRHPLYRQLSQNFPDLPEKLFARRARHSFGNDHLTVTEILLPAILDYTRP